MKCNNKYFKNKIVLITGGFGNIGKKLLDRYYESGSIILVIDKFEISEVTLLLKEYKSSRIFYFKCDLSKDSERYNLYTKVKEKFGYIDILINNAAFVGTSNLQGWNEPFKYQSLESWNKALELNLTAPFHLSQLFAGFLLSRKGVILNVSSIYGVVAPTLDIYNGIAMNNPAAYGASKAGLIYLTKWLAVNLSPNVRVNSISIGGIKRDQDSIFQKRYIKNTPLKRMGLESDVVGGVMFLTSDESAWITGHNLIIDGGWTIK